MVEVVAGRVVLELLVEIEAFGLVEAREVVVVYVERPCDLQYAVGLCEVMQVGVKLADIQQGVCVVPVLAALVEGAVGAEEEDEGEGVALVLFGYVRHAGVDAPTINRIVYLCAVGCDIMLGCLGDLAVETAVATHIVVRFAEVVVCKETAERVVERADGLLKRCGVGIEQVFVLVQTVCHGDSVLSFLIASSVAT